MNKPHKHAALIKAWADGAQIQYRDDSGEWADAVPYWLDGREYRIKPEPKPHIVEEVMLFLDEDKANIHRGVMPNVRLVFDGETGKLEYAEVIK